MMAERVVVGLDPVQIEEEQVIPGTVVGSARSAGHARRLPSSVRTSVTEASSSRLRLAHPPHAFVQAPGGEAGDAGRCDGEGVHVAPLPGMGENGSGG